MHPYLIQVSRTQKIELQIGNIIDLDVDILVHLTDGQLYTDVESTISNEIWMRGGDELQKEIKSLRKSEDLIMNKIYLTNGGDLNAKLIFHVPLRPLRSKKGLGRTAADADRVTFNVLERTKEKGFNSIAIPPIGTRNIVEVQVRRIINYFKEDLKKEMMPFHVLLVVETEDLFKTFKDKFERVYFGSTWQKKVIKTFQQTQQRLLPEDKEEDFFRKFEEEIHKQ